MKTLFSVSLVFLSLTFVNLFSQTWLPTNSIPDGAGVTDMAMLSDGTMIVTTASHNWPSGQQGGIRRSTDGGNTWQNVMNAFNGRTLYAGVSGRIFASVWQYPANEGLFFSTDGGQTWIQNYFGPANDNVFSVAAKNSDSMVFIGTRNGIFRNFNNGAWIQLAGFPANSWVRDIAIDSSGIIAAATTNGVFISTNHGNLWRSCTGVPAGDTVVSVCFGSEFNQLSSTERKVLYAGSDDGKVLKSFRDNGEYTALFLANAFLGSNEEVNVYGLYGSLDEYTRIILAARYPRLPDAKGGVSFSTNGGASFTDINNGLSSPAKVSKAIIDHTTRSEQTFYCGLYNGTSSGAVIYKTTISTGLQQISNTIPENFTLKQNYPNPFNPSTKINFSISEKADVNLKIYNELGNEIENQIHQNLSAGEYSIEWIAKELPSGTYFCRLTSGNFSQSIRMVLLK